MTYQEDNLIVPGIKSISVRYIPEKKDASPDTIANAQNETSDTALSTTDSIKTADVSSQPAKKKKYSSGVLLLIIALDCHLRCHCISFYLKMRKDAILKKIEEDDF